MSQELACLLAVADIGKTGDYRYILTCLEAQGHN
jgi:hypothetical protein